MRKLEERFAPALVTALTREEVEADVRGEPAPTVFPPSEASPPQAGIRKGEYAKPLDLEQWIGRTLFLGLGTVALILSAGYFITYTTREEILTLGVRVSIVAILGTLLLVLGDSQFGNLTAFGYSLVGGGFGLLLISVYGLLIGLEKAPYPLIFGVMLIITVAMAFLSVRHSTLPLALLGFLGGFLAPAWIGISIATGYWARSQMELVSKADYIILSIYVVILSFGAIVLGLREKWQVLPFIGMFFSYVVLGGLYEGVPDAVRLTGISVVFIVFLTSPIYRSVTFPNAVEAEHLLNLIANCVLFAVFKVERIYSGVPVIQETIGMVTTLFLAFLAVTLP